MICKKCGGKLPDDVKFCTFCGTPTDLLQDEAAGQADSSFSSWDSMATGENSGQGAASGGFDDRTVSVKSARQSRYYDGNQGKAAKPPKPPKPPKKVKAGPIVLGIIGAAALIALVFLGIRVLPRFLGGGSKAVYAYRNDDGELMFLSDLKEKTAALELSDDADGSVSVAFSPDGKTVFFTNSDRALYSISVSALKNGDKAERIARDVSSFFTLDDGKLFYFQYDGGESKLSVWDKGESYRLLKDYYTYSLSEDQKTIYYTQKNETDGTFSLYKMAVSQGESEERLLKGANRIYSDYDAEVLLYGIYDSEDEETVTLYSCKPGEDKTKLMSDVHSVRGVKVSGGKLDFYYEKEDVEEHTLYDYVTDVKASEDAAVLSAGEPEYPDWSGHYAPKEVYAKGQEVLYQNAGGEVYPVNLQQLPDSIKQEIHEVVGEGYTLADVLEAAVEVYPSTFKNLANQDANARYDKAAEEYSNLADQWNEAWNRESIRSSLKDSEYDRVTYSLYHYKDGGKEGDLVGSEIFPSGKCYDAAADGIFFYVKTSGKTGTVADVADLSYSSEVYDLIDQEGADQDRSWYQNVGGKESEIDLKDVAGISDVFVLNDKEVLLDVYDGEESSLRSFDLGKTSLTYTDSVVEGNDYSVGGLGTASGSDVLYVFTEIDYSGDEKMADLCVYRDGKLETVAREVYGAMFLDESDTGFLLTDYDDRNETVEVARLDDGKQTTVSDEIDGNGSLIVLDASRVLYMSDGDLCLWDGKEERTIARDVEEFWTSVSADYTSYSPY